MSRITTVRPLNNLRHGVHLIRNRKTFWQMLRAVINGSYKMSFLTTAIAILSIAYIIFPFDIIPDFIPVVGWLDDGAVLYLLLKRLSKETQRYSRQKAMARKNS
jgi:uncharacterized membrane protein YkvA (DUF1232 family)